MNIVPECIRVRTDLYRLSVATKMSSGAARANLNTTPALGATELPPPALGATEPQHPLPALGATEPQHPTTSPLGGYGIDHAAPLELTRGAVIVDHG